jgi:hypothetical protein
LVIDLRTTCAKRDSRTKLERPANGLIGQIKNPKEFLDHVFNFNFVIILKFLHMGSVYRHALTLDFSWEQDFPADHVFSQIFFSQETSFTLSKSCQQQLL